MENFEKMVYLLSNLSIRFSITGSKNFFNSSPNVFEHAFRQHVNNWHINMSVVYMWP